MKTKKRLKALKAAMKSVAMIQRSSHLGVIRTVNPEMPSCYLDSAIEAAKALAELSIAITNIEQFEAAQAARDDGHDFDELIAALEQDRVKVVDGAVEVHDEPVGHPDHHAIVEAIENVQRFGGTITVSHDGMVMDVRPNMPPSPHPTQEWQSWLNSISVDPGKIHADLMQEIKGEQDRLGGRVTPESSLDIWLQAAHGNPPPDCLDKLPEGRHYVGYTGQMAPSSPAEESASCTFPGPAPQPMDIDRMMHGIIHDARAADGCKDMNPITFSLSTPGKVRQDIHDSDTLDFMDRTNLNFATGDQRCWSYRAGPSIGSMQLVQGKDGFQDIRNCLRAIAQECSHNDDDLNLESDTWLLNLLDRFNKSFGDQAPLSWQAAGKRLPDGRVAVLWEQRNQGESIRDCAKTMMRRLTEGN